MVTRGTSQFGRPGDAPDFFRPPTWRWQPTSTPGTALNAISKMPGRCRIDARRRRISLARNVIASAACQPWPWPRGRLACGWRAPLPARGLHLPLSLAKGRESIRRASRMWSLGSVSAATLKCTRFAGRSGTPTRTEVEALLARYLLLTIYNHVVIIKWGHPRAPPFISARNGLA